MKFVTVALLAVLGTSAVVFSNFPKFPTPASKPASSENVVVKSASVSGNLADTRLAPTGELVSLEKKVVKAKVDSKRVLYLTEVVQFDTMQSLTNSIKKLQAESSEPIYLLIDSPGGSVLDGATLISEMEVSKAPVYTVCTRLCASMAAMIHSYGAKRYITDRALLMYHPASAGAGGQVPNMLSQLTTITRYLDKMVANITSRSKISKNEYEQLVAYELWIDAEDSVAKGLSDSIINLNVPSYDEQEVEVLGPQRPEEDKSTNKPKAFDVQMISPYPEMWTHRNAR